MNVTPILEKVEKIEKSLQELKVSLLLDYPEKKTDIGIYDQSELVKEIKRVRKKLWNEKYEKTAKGLS